MSTFYEGKEVSLPLREKHSKTPWRLSGSCIPKREIKDAENYDVALCDLGVNADFIVRAVNEYEPMTTRLQYRDGDVERAEAQINHLKQINAALLEAAKEMFDLLSRTPNGPLWPKEEEFSRDFVRWSQRIAQAEKPL